MAKANVKHARNPKRRYFVTGSGQLIQGTINFLVLKDPAELKAAEAAATLLANLGSIWFVFHSEESANDTYDSVFKGLEELRIIRH